MTDTSRQDAKTPRTPKKSGCCRVLSGTRKQVPRFAPLRLCVMLLLAALPAAAQVQGQGHGARAEVVRQIDALLAEPWLKGGIQGVIVQSLRDGTTWYERNADLLFMSASNEKLLTSAAVLNALGPDWKFVTTLQRTGSVDADGTLHGDLYLHGGGDPLLDDKDLDALVQSAKDAGIRRVEGRVVGDDSRFDSQRYGDSWEWDDMPYYYSAQISGLNLDENVETLKIDPGRRAGEPVKVTESPTERYLRVLDRGRTVASGGKSTLRVSRILGQNVATVDGTLSVNARSEDHRPTPVTVEDPGLFAATVFTERLVGAGVSVAGAPKTGPTPNGATEIGRHESPPMSEVLRRLNKPSDNLVAECLLKTLGAERGSGGSTAAGREVALAWFKQLGLDTERVQMTDGSGLSRQTLVSPRNLAILLRAMYSHPQSRVYIDSLPIAGVDGTLRNRMKGTPAEGNCHGKTGSLSGVSSMSGYVTTKAGEPLAFVILMNNHPAPSSVAHRIQDSIAVFLASWNGAPQSASRGFHRRMLASRHRPYKRSSTAYRTSR